LAVVDNNYEDAGNKNTRSSHLGLTYENSYCVQKELQRQELCSLVFQLWPTVTYAQNIDQQPAMIDDRTFIFESSGWKRC
jgi:hypothetical protein